MKFVGEIPRLNVLDDSCVLITPHVRLYVFMLVTIISYDSWV